MSGYLKNIIKKTGVVDFIRRSTIPAMLFPPFSKEIQQFISAKPDYFRFATYGLAIQKILDENIPGSFAEAGVYQGQMSSFINLIAPQKKLYLFDTFRGFDEKDLDRSDERFKDTDVDSVLSKIKYPDNVVIKKGYVPETFKGLENEIFSFVLLDMDLHKPTVAGLQFFYPRVSKGGYIIIHDYNNPESDWACKRAVNEFFKDKPELPIEIADNWGSVMVRKT